MPSVRSLLVSDPFLPFETRDAIARGHDLDAARGLVTLGVDCGDVAELLGWEGGDCGCDEPLDA